MDNDVCFENGRHSAKKIQCFGQQYRADTSMRRDLPWSHDHTDMNILVTPTRRCVGHNTLRLADIMSSADAYPR